MAVDVVGLFQKHVLHEYGVVNVRAVINELTNRKEDPVFALNQVLDNARAGDWHFYAAEGLRSLATQGTLEATDGRKLLDATRSLYQQFGLDEYYKSVTALAASARTAPLLVEFIDQQLERHDVRDWRWLAFFAAGTLLQHMPHVLTRRLADRLQYEAANEHDSGRKGQMLDVAARCLSVTSLSVTSGQAQTSRSYLTDQYEGMIAETVSMKGHNGDAILAYVARPLEAGPFPGMVVVHHAPGWDEWYRECTRRFAHHGYVAISPNLYHRDGHGKPEDVGAKVRAAGGAPDPRVLGDLEGAIAWLRALPNLNGKVGIFGTCSGGRQAFLAGCKLKGLNAVIECWGGRVVMSKGELTPAQPVAPIDYTKDLSCPILGLFGNEDKSPTPEQVNQHEAELKKNGKQYEFHRYDGAGHGFFYYDRPAYRQEQAVDGWKKVFVFCEKNLR